MMPLVFANVGEESIIRKVGGSPEVRAHLEDLGFVTGGNVTDLHRRREPDCEHQGFPRGNQPRNGEQNHGVTARTD